MTAPPIGFVPLRDAVSRYQNASVLIVSSDGKDVSLAPVRQALAGSGQVSADDEARASAYAEGLARWRARDFAGAAECFERCARADPPSALFMARAKACAANPPGPEWEPVNTLEGK